MPNYFDEINLKLGGKNMSQSKSMLKFSGIFLVLFLAGFFAIGINGACPDIVENLNTGECFSSIQDAIDDADTLNGHTIKIAAVTIYEHVVVNKSLTLEGYHMYSTYVYGTGTCSTDVMQITANNVTVRNLCVSGCGGSGSGIYNGIKIEGNNCKIESVMAVESYRNIFVAGATNTIIRGCWVSTTWDTDEEITLMNATDSKIYKNRIFRANTPVNQGFGVLLIGTGTTGNYIYSNEIYNHEYGVYMWAVEENEISTNKIEDNDYGIYMDSASQNDIIANDIKDNSEGLYLFNASNSNNIHRNDFVNNSIHQAYIDNTLPSFPCVYNNWYHGPTIVGNYWDDHVCQDPNNDGICNNYYSIPRSNGGFDIDPFPLANPYVVVCGNVDGSFDGVVDTNDYNYLINYLFVSGPPPIPRCAGDVNGDGRITITDIAILGTTPPPTACLCN